MNDEPIEGEFADAGPAEGSGSTAIVTVSPPETAVQQLWGTADPTGMMARGGAIATALAEAINSGNMSTEISGRRYVLAEGWALAGSMLGIFARTLSVKPVEGCIPEFTNSRGKSFSAVDGIIGYEATVQLTMHDQVVGQATAFCFRDEERWHDRPNHQIASMAQTRAASKAFRTTLGFIMPMAGFAPTPADELDGDERSEPKRQQRGGQQPKAATGEDAETPAPARRRRPQAQALKPEDVRDLATLLRYAHQAHGLQPTDVAAAFEVDTTGEIAAAVVEGFNGEFDGAAAHVTSIAEAAAGATDAEESPESAPEPAQSAD